MCMTNYSLRYISSLTQLSRCMILLPMIQHETLWLLFLITSLKSHYLNTNISTLLLPGKDLKIKYSMKTSACLIKLKSNLVINLVSLSDIICPVRLQIPKHKMHNAVTIVVRFVNSAQWGFTFSMIFNIYYTTKWLFQNRRLET